MHRVAADSGEAGALALAAGIDVELPDTLGFGAGLVERVRAASVPEELVDRAARRLLLAEGRARPARPGLDAGGLGAPTPATSTSTRRPTGRWPGSWPSARSCCSTPAPRCRCSARAARRCGGSPWSARAPTTRARSWAATPSPTTCCPATPGSGSASRCRRRSTRCGPSCPASSWSTSRAARCRATTAPGSPPPSRPPATPTCASRCVGDLAGLFGHGTSGEGCDAEDLRLPGRAGRAARRAARRPARRWSSSWSPAARTRSASCTGRAAGLVQAFMPGEEGGAAHRRRAVRPGAARAASCRCRSRALPGGQPSTYLQPPLGGAESAGISIARPDAAVPVRLRRVVHHVRGRRPARQRHARCRPTASSTVDRAGRATPASAPATRSSSSTCTTCVAQVARPVRQLTGFARVRAGAGRRRRRAFRRARRPDRVHRPRPASASSSPASSRSWSAPRRPTCPAGPRSGSPGPRVVGHDRRLDTPVRTSQSGTLAAAEQEGPSMSTSRRAAPRWPPSPPRPASRSPPSRRCSTAAATSPRPPARGYRTCWSSTTTSAAGSSRGSGCRPSSCSSRASSTRTRSRSSRASSTTAGSWASAVAVGVKVGGTRARPRAEAGEWARGLAAAGRAAVIAVTSELPGPRRPRPPCRRARVPARRHRPDEPPAPDVTSVGSTNFAGGLAATQAPAGARPPPHRLPRRRRPRRPATRPGCSGFRGAMEAAGSPCPGTCTATPAPSTTTTARQVAGRCSTCRSRRPPSSPVSDEIALGVDRGGPGARAAGARGPQRRRLRRHPDRPVRLAAADHGPPAAAGDGRRSRCAPPCAWRPARRSTPHHVELATELVVRSSTAAPAAT